MITSPKRLKEDEKNEIELILSQFDKEHLLEMVMEYGSESDQFITYWRQRLVEIKAERGE